MIGGGHDPREAVKESQEAAPRVYVANRLIAVDLDKQEAEQGQPKQNEQTADQFDAKVLNIRSSSQARLVAWRSRVFIKDVLCCLPS